MTLVMTLTGNFFEINDTRGVFLLNKSITPDFFGVYWRNYLFQASIKRIPYDTFLSILMLEIYPSATTVSGSQCFYQDN